MNRFFVENIGPGVAVIEGEDCKHLASVLRLKKGDHVMLSDGKGSECQGEIEHVEPGRALVKTGPWRPSISEPHHKLTLFQCLPKTGKMEVILQKCTELGMNALVPTLSARCVDCVGANDAVILSGFHFASAPAARIASSTTDYAHSPADLCLSARCADCVGKNAQIMTQYVVHNAVSR